MIGGGAIHMSRFICFEAEFVQALGFRNASCCHLLLPAFGRSGLFGGVEFVRFPPMLEIGIHVHGLLQKKNLVVWGAGRNFKSVLRSKAHQELRS